MDIVITYVNGSDPVWQKSFQESVGKAPIVKRYRDWDTLKYLLRGIETNMPFIENVFLVVSGKSQVPAWANQDKLKIVLHEDIIPARHLPTFNSTTIELFLHRIPGLAEEFIYFNDDIFPLLPCSPEDFFRGGKAVLGFRKCLLCTGQFRKQTRNSDHAALDAAGLPHKLMFIRPQHTATTMLKSASKEVFDKMEAYLSTVISPLRTDRNVNQYIFLDYQKATGRAIDEPLSNKHISFASATEEKLRSYFSSPTRKLVCINDTKMSPEKTERFRTLIPELFSGRFPVKSAFEL